MSAQNDSMGSKATVVLFCVLLIMGSVMFFLLFEAMNAKNPDPYMASHEYTFEGEIYGEICTGSGTIVNTPENANAHLYSLEYTLQSAVVRESFQFGILFGLDDRPDSSIYSYVGTETIGEKELSVWKGEKSSLEYIMYIGEKCTIEKLLIESDDHHVAGYLVE